MDIQKIEDGCSEETEKKTMRYNSFFVVTCGLCVRQIWSTLEMGK